VAGLFLVYALTLIPGLLIGGPASDRFGRRWR
jgi:MFS family permease